MKAGSTTTNAVSLCQIKMSTLVIMAMTKSQTVVPVTGDYMEVMIAEMAVVCKCKLIKALLRVSNTEN